MAEATLSSPLTLDPQQAAKLRFTTAEIDFRARTVTAFYEMVDASGNVIALRRLILDGPQVQTWITNQESALYSRLLAKLGVTGTVA